MTAAGPVTGRTISGDRDCGTYTALIVATPMSGAGGQRLERGTVTHTAPVIVAAVADVTAIVVVIAVVAVAVGATLFMIACPGASGTASTAGNVGMSAGECAI